VALSVGRVWGGGCENFFEFSSKKCRVLIIVIAKKTIYLLSETGTGVLNRPRGAEDVKSTEWAENLARGFNP